MPPRKSRTRRFEFVRAYSPPAACLALWLGVCAVAWVSPSNLALPGFAKSRPPDAATQNASQSNDSLASRLSAFFKSDHRDSGEPPQDNVTATEVAATNTSVEPRIEAMLLARPPEHMAGQTARKEQSIVDTATPKPKATETSTGDAPAEEAKPATTGDNTPNSDHDAPLPAASSKIARARLTSGIADLEPVDRITDVFHSNGKTLRRLYYFTELKGLRGKTVHHDWWHDGRRIARVTSHVRSNSWRMYSGKKLIPSMAGPWRVVVTDGHGKTLSVARFAYKVP